MNRKDAMQAMKEEIKNCNKCALSETRVNALPGEGDIGARIMLVAQAPGETEDREGRMFVGPTGKALDRLFGEFGMKRSGFYLTNLVKCMLPNYRKPRQEEIDACSEYLNREIELVDPQIIAPMGYYAISYIFKKYHYLESAKKEDTERHHGKLVLMGGRKVYPLAHPTALIFDASDKEKIKKDYSKLKVLLHECKWYPVCPMRRFHEDGVLETKWTELYCKGDWESCVRYQMEENGEMHPDWMLPDGSLDLELKNSCLY